MGRGLILWLVVRCIEKNAALIKQADQISHAYSSFILSAMCAKVLSIQSHGCVPHISLSTPF